MPNARDVGRRVLAVAVAGGLAMTSPARSQDRPPAYLLGPGDVLQITVVGKPELTGKFRIGPEGALSYPIVGALPVSGRTTEEVASNLAEQLTQRLPIRTAPAVEVAEFASIFVAGDVEKPGQYPFRPGMVALELISLAGGLRRATAPLETRALQLISVEQTVEDRRVQIFGKRIERARLEAEINDADFAPDIKAAEADAPIDAGEAAKLVANEKELFAVRKKVFANQIASLRDQRVAYDREEASLKESIKLHDSEIEMLEQETATSQRLFDRQLTVLATVLGLKRQLSATRRDALEIESYLARAQQHQLEVDQKIQDVGDQQRKENAISLRELDIAIARIERELSAAVLALGETRAQLGRDAVAPTRPTYEVARLVDGAYQVKTVDDFTALMARDILRVARNTPERSVKQSALDAPAPAALLQSTSDR